jgi:hypothetical protein
LTEATGGQRQAPGRVERGIAVWQRGIDKSARQDGREIAVECLRLAGVEIGGVNPGIRAGFRYGEPL